MRLFHKADDYEAFHRVLAEGLERYPIELLTYCLMPNDGHLVVRPKMDPALGRWMGWVGVTHVRRHCGRPQSVWGLPSPFVVPADHQNGSLITDGPFSSSPFSSSMMTDQPSPQPSGRILDLSTWW